MNWPRILAGGCLLWLAVLSAVFGGGGEATLPDESLYASGRYVYERNCLTCHGRYGDGRGELANEMFPKPRPFNSGVFKYRSTPSSALPTTEDLIRTVRLGRANTSMPIFDKLSDSEVRAVVEYLKFFSRRWQKLENYAPPVVLPAAPRWLNEPSEVTRHSEAGRKTYLLACASCHGENTDGQGTAALGLVDAWENPCPPSDLRAPAFRNGRTAPDIFRVLTLGIDGTPMPSYAEALTVEQRWELAVFIGK
jgi:mono/diheme cytochrome c family protein